MKAAIFSPRDAVIGLTAALVVGSAQAQDITCRNGDAVHRVQVVVEDSRRGLPCEIILWSTPTDQKRLWRAEFERGFCAEKLQAIIKQRTDGGWRCQLTDPPRIKPRQARRQPVM